MAASSPSVAMGPIHGATNHADLLTGIGWIMKTAGSKFNWGIWLKDRREWAALPPRLCKPTPFNCNDVPALHDELDRLVAAGYDAELRQFDTPTLNALRKEYRSGK